MDLARKRGSLEDRYGAPVCLKLQTPARSHPSHFVVKVQGQLAHNRHRKLWVMPIPHGTCLPSQARHSPTHGVSKTKSSCVTMTPPHCLVYFVVRAELHTLRPAMLNSPSISERKRSIVRHLLFNLLLATNESSAYNTFENIILAL